MSIYVRVRLINDSRNRVNYASKSCGLQSLGGSNRAKRDPNPLASARNERRELALLFFDQY